MRLRGKTDGKAASPTGYTQTILLVSDFIFTLSNFYYPAIWNVDVLPYFHAMKRKSLLVLFLLVLSGIAGYVLSKASLVGKAGISLFYTQYKFLKTWWQGGLVVFAVWMLLFFLQGLAQRKWSTAASRLVHFAAIIAALAGLYFTYQDFRHTLSHRWLGERFHLGGYLFWIGWMAVSLFYLTENKKVKLGKDLSPGPDAAPAPGERHLTP